jgi:glycosyltransferase involved in cell wall biosynthesis
MNGPIIVPMINLAFDAKRFFQNSTGLGNYSRTLILNLNKYHSRLFKFFLFSPISSENYFSSQKKQSFITVFPPWYKRFFWRIFGVPTDCKKNLIHIYHGLSNELPVEIGKHPNIKWVVTIHDIAFLYYKMDYSFFDRFIHFQKIKYSCQKADVVIAVSEYTKTDICKKFNLPPEKVAVIYQTVNDTFKKIYTKADFHQVEKLYQLPNRYFLSVGSITARKNLLSALKAWKGLPTEYQWPFLIIGKPNRKYFKKIKEELELFKEIYSDKIIFKNVTNDHLPIIYQNAEIFIYPSYFEGFGIPVLEALYSGTPVITSKTTSLAEVGGPGAYLVDPANFEEIKEGILFFMQNGEQKKSAVNKGLEHIKNFDAQLVTDKLVRIYQSLLQ